MIPKLDLLCPKLNYEIVWLEALLGLSYLPLAEFFFGQH